MLFTCKEPGNMDNAPHPHESGVATNISLAVDRDPTRLVVPHTVLVQGGY